MRSEKKHCGSGSLSESQEANYSWRLPPALSKKSSVKCSIKQDARNKLFFAIRLPELQTITTRAERTTRPT
jgi:hypothetical protein